MLVLIFLNNSWKMAIEMLSWKYSPRPYIFSHNCALLCL